MVPDFLIIIIIIIIIIIYYYLYDILTVNNTLRTFQRQICVLWTIGDSAEDDDDASMSTIATIVKKLKVANKAPQKVKVFASFSYE